MHEIEFVHARKAAHFGSSDEILSVNEEKSKSELHRKKCYSTRRASVALRLVIRFANSHFQPSSSFFFTILNVRKQLIGENMNSHENVVHHHFKSDTFYRSMRFLMFRNWAFRFRFAFRIYRSADRNRSTLPRCWASAKFGLFKWIFRRITYG